MAGPGRRFLLINRLKRSTVPPFPQPCQGQAVREKWVAADADWLGKLRGGCCHIDPARGGLDNRVLEINLFPATQLMALKRDLS